MAIFGLAAVAEIGGCFVAWRVLRGGAHPAWLLAAAGLLAAFAWALAQTDQAFAGRAFAAYGGVYVAASLGWLWLVEGVVPTGRDLLGGVVMLAGAAIIHIGGRS